MRSVCIHIFIFLTLCSGKGFAQHGTSGQAIFTMVSFNPAYAGMKSHSGAFLNYRNQWSDFEGNYINYHAGYTQFINKLQGGLGIKINNYTRNKGLMNDLSIDGIYSYQLQVGRHSHLYGGLQASYGGHYINKEKLKLGDMYDPVTEDFSLSTSEQIESSFHHYVDFSTGILWNHWNYRNNTTLQTGISVYHLTQPKYTNTSEKKRKFTVHASYRFPFHINRLGRETIHMEPAILYRQQLHFNELMYGIHLHMPQYYAGLNFRQNIDFYTFNISLSGGIKHDFYTLLYSYEMILGSQYLYLSNLGTHEVTFLYHLKYKEKKPAFR